MINLSGISVMIIPCFNEENRLNIDYWKQIINERLNVHWIFINDGSTDKTIEILSELDNRNNVSILNYSKNKGKAEAIRAGMNEALKLTQSIRLVGYCDSDCAFTSEDIFNLLDRAITDIHNQKLLKVWISSRIALSGRKIIRRKNRHYLGRIIATFITMGWNSAPYDTQSGLKLFSFDRELKSAISTPFKTKWFCDLELISRILIHNPEENIIWEEPLNYWKDIGGSKITIRQFPKILIEIYQIKKIVVNVKRINK